MVFGIEFVWEGFGGSMLWVGCMWWVIGKFVNLFCKLVNLFSKVKFVMFVLKIIVVLKWLFKKRLFNCFFVG